MKVAAISLLIPVLAATPGQAASVEVTVRDARGAAVEDAVAWAMPKGAGAAGGKRTAAVQQIDKTFVPYVTVIQAGTPVSFPNRDEIRHHVYSFSPAKIFEIKLYAGTPAAPVLFDKPGEVVLGCNIHDHMVGYIYVVDTPHFAKSGKDGRARIDDVPAGDYDLLAWHPQQSARAEPQPMKVGDDLLERAFTFALKPRPARPAPK